MPADNFKPSVFKLGWEKFLGLALALGDEDPGAEATDAHSGGDDGGRQRRRQGRGVRASPLRPSLVGSRLSAPPISWGFAPQRSAHLLGVRASPLRPSLGGSCLALRSSHG